MEFRPRAATSKGGPDRFVGDVWIDGIETGADGSHVRVSLVRFAPGARTAWHAHTLGQTLHVLSGTGRIQARGGPVFELGAGDTIWTPPREWHWHGGAPDAFMAHLAIWEVPTDGPESEWAEQVAETDYGSDPEPRR